jgi:hypothetical protein
MDLILLPILFVINQIIAAGNTITAFSLLLYALTFNLRERVARAFALLLVCVTITYFGDVLVGVTPAPAVKEMWLRLQWLGISFVPAAFFHLSDALLDATGRPSRGRRRMLIRVEYALSGLTLIGATLTPAIGLQAVHAGPVTYLRAGPWFPLFTIYFFGNLALAGNNFRRAYARCLSGASRRRMVYLIVGSVGPLLGSFPFLMLAGGPFFDRLPPLFMGLLVAINAVVAILLVMMADAVAYYGVSYPDRVVKSRLMQWILRGPVVASTVLASGVIVNRAALLAGAPNSLVVPFAMVSMLLLLQFLITLVRPSLERVLYYGEEYQDIARLQLLQQRLVTTGDLRQFFESILNAACDILQSPSAFIAVVGEEGLELEVAVGPDDPLRGSEDLAPILLHDREYQFDRLGGIFSWDHYWLIPIDSPEGDDVIGLVGLRATAPSPQFTEEEEEAVASLIGRASIALANRVLQKEIFRVVDQAVPEAEALQQMRAAARYRGEGALASLPEGAHTEADLANLVKDALGHYWGGPRLTDSPLLRLQVVREAVGEHGGNPVNALRAILRKGIERTKPEGKRRFTAEWMLYNILEMKFLEGRKVRDVAMHLAMSEADLYRKQKVAIESVARAITDMEREAISKASEREGVGM